MRYVRIAAAASLLWAASGCSTRLVLESNGRWAGQVGAIGPGYQDYREVSGEGDKTFSGESCGRFWSAAGEKGDLTVKVLQSGPLGAFPRIVDEDRVRDGHPTVEVCPD